MTTAFQVNAFQNNAFQIDASTATTPVVGGSSGRGGRKRRRVLVQLDGHTFEVESAAAAQSLLAQARELAQQQALSIAEAALAKSAKAKRPEAKARALQVPIPQIEIVEIDYADELGQQIRAQIDAANAALAEIYQTAMLEATRAMALRLVEDEDEAIIMLMLHG